MILFTTGLAVGITIGLIIGYLFGFRITANIMQEYNRLAKELGLRRGLDKHKNDPVVDKSLTAVSMQYDRLSKMKFVLVDVDSMMSKVNDKWRQGLRGGLDSKGIFCDRCLVKIHRGEFAYFNREDSKAYCQSCKEKLEPKL